MRSLMSCMAHHTPYCSSVASSEHEAQFARRPVRARVVDADTRRRHNLALAVTLFNPEAGSAVGSPAVQHAVDGESACQFRRSNDISGASNEYRRWMSDRLGHNVEHPVQAVD